MAYIIKIKNDKNKILYLPKGYGHGIHELTEEKEKAWKFEKREVAQKIIRSMFFMDNAFWESEKRAQELSRQKYKNWEFQVLIA